MLYFVCISFSILAYPDSSISLLFISGNIPSCFSVQSVIRFIISISSFSVISLSQFTFIVLFTKSIAIGLSSSFIGLSGSSADIILPSCCKYNILEFSSIALSHIIPSSFSKCNPSFALFITSINSVSSVSLLWNSLNLFSFSLSPYSPSIEWKLGFMSESLKYSIICFSYSAILSFPFFLPIIFPSSSSKFSINGKNTRYFPPCFTFSCSICFIPFASLTLLLSFSYFSNSSFLVLTSSIESIFSFKLSKLPSVCKVYSHDTILGFITNPILIAFIRLIFIATCFPLTASLFVYPSFSAISFAMFIPSTSLLGVAVIPNTFDSSVWFSINSSSLFPHSFAPVLCNSSSTINPYCFFINSSFSFDSNPGYVANFMFGNISATSSSLLFPNVFTGPCIYFII